MPIENAECSSSADTDDYLCQPVVCYNRHNLSVVFTARCTIVHSAVLRLHVVRPSVCPPLSDVGGSGPHGLEILETNCTDN